MPDSPPTPYGPNPLSAASLSVLHPIIAIFQLQLLANLAIKDLLTRVDEAANVAMPEQPSASSAPVVERTSPPRRPRRWRHCSRGEGPCSARGS